MTSAATCSPRAPEASSELGSKPPSPMHPTYRQSYCDMVVYRRVCGVGGGFCAGASKRHRSIELLICRGTGKSQRESKGATAGYVPGYPAVGMVRASDGPIWRFCRGHDVGQIGRCVLFVRQ